MSTPSEASAELASAELQSSPGAAPRGADLEVKPTSGGAASPESALEAMLLAAGRAVTPAALLEAIRAVGVPGFAHDDLAPAVARLNSAYAQTGRTFRIESTAGGYRLMTLAAHAPAVAALQKAREPGRLSRAAIETLAVIAYRQPVTRAELEAIRGVACGEVLSTLVERKLVTITGRAEELGRPMLYGTTRHFLDRFGLASLKDLPTPEELRAEVPVYPATSADSASSDAPSTPSAPAAESAGSEAH